jgi:type IV pilus assembly protein PilM
VGPVATSIGSMSKRGVVGLDIGTSAVRAAELTVGTASATLQKFGQVALPEGAVRDGEIHDADAVTAAVRQLWSTVKFTSKKVVIGVANQRVVVRQVDLPWMPEKELRKSLALQVGDMIPMPVEQAVLDFHTIEDLVNDQGQRMLRVMLVAAGKEMISIAVEAVTRAGLQPTMVDLTPFAVMRSLGGGGGVMGLDNESEAIVEVGADVTNIVVHLNGQPRFVRVLLLGGRDITDTLAERMGVDHLTAEGTKLGMVMSPDPTHIDSHPASRALETAAAQWIDEVRQSLDFHLSQSAGERIRRVVLTGGASQLGGLPQRLATASRLPVVVASPLSGLKLGRTGLAPDQLASVQARMAVPVGLALGRAS